MRKEKRKTIRTQASYETYVFQIWESNCLTIDLKGYVMSGEGGQLEGDFLPTMEVSKKAEDRGVESKSEGLMFELRDQHLIAAGKELKSKTPKSFKTSTSLVLTLQGQITERRTDTSLVKRAILNISI